MRYDYTIQQPWQAGETPPVCIQTRNAKQTRAVAIFPDHVRARRHPKAINLEFADVRGGGSGWLSLSLMDAQRLVTVLQHALKESQPDTGHDTWLNVEA